MTLKRVLEIAAVLSVLGGLLLFNRYAANLSTAAQQSLNAYYIQRIIMAFWLALAGFLVELPRIYTDLSQARGRIKLDWAVLLIFGIPALILALLPIVNSVFKLPVPMWLLIPNALPAEVIGAFLFGIAVGRAVTKEEYRVF